MSRVVAIAGISIREVSRRRLVVALLLLSALAIGFTGWGFSRLPTLRDRGVPLTPAELTLISSQFLIFVLFMFSAVLGLSAVMVSAQAIAAEIESGQALAVLARPVRRAEVVLGKLLGLGVLVVLYAVVAMTLELLVVDWATGYVPPNPVHAVAFVAGEGLVLLTLTLLLSVRLSGITAGVVALMLFFVTWIAGVAGAVGAALNNGPIETVGTVSRLLLPSDGLWRGAIFNLEPAAAVAAENGSREAAANPFTSLTPATGAYIAWAVAWVLVVVGVTIWTFRRREV